MASHSVQISISYSNSLFLRLSLLNIWSAEVLLYLAKQFMISKYHIYTYNSICKYFNQYSCMPRITNIYTYPHQEALSYACIWQRCHNNIKMIIINRRRMVQTLAMHRSSGAAADTFKFWVPWNDGHGHMDQLLNDWSWNHSSALQGCIALYTYCLT